MVANTEKKKPIKYLEWELVDKHDYNYVHLSGNAYAAKYSVIKNEPLGYGPGCTKCEKPKQKTKQKENKKEKQLDPTKFDRIYYDPLYVGCDRAVADIKPSTGDFLRYQHADNIQYKIVDPDYNPSNIYTSFFRQKTISPRLDYTGAPGILKINTCLFDEDTQRRVATSAFNKSREIARNQITASIYQPAAYDKIYKQVLTNTDYQETFQYFSYMLSLVASAIREGKQTEYSNFNPVDYEAVRITSEEIADALYKEKPQLDSQEEINAFINYVKGRVFALYVSTEIGIRHVASEHGMLQIVKDIEGKSQITQLSPSFIDILDRTYDTLLAYLDAYYVVDPTNAEAKKFRREQSIFDRTKNRNTLIDFPVNPIQRML